VTPQFSNTLEDKLVETSIPTEEPEQTAYQAQFFWRVETHESIDDLLADYEWTIVIWKVVDFRKLLINKLCPIKFEY